MLKQRVITALALIAVLLGSLFFAPAWVFSSLMLILLGAGLWEWAKLNALPHYALTYAIAGMLLFLCLDWAREHVFGTTLWAGSTLLWLGLFYHFLRKYPLAWGATDRRVRLLLGLLLIAPVWGALQPMRTLSLNFLLSSLALVWLADIGAYFFGSRFGSRWFTRKLAPSISPKKTWEGVLGAMLFMILGSSLWLTLERAFGWPDSLMQRLLERFGLLGLIFSYALILGFAIAGDLFESLVKRSAGTKDSSQLLPGHGGVLDRLDAILPTVPLILLLVQ